MIYFFTISISIFLYFLFTKFLHSDFLQFSFPSFSKNLYLKNILIKFLSPDLHFAKISKNDIINSYKHSSDFYKLKKIEFWNNFNFLVSIFLFLIISISFFNLSSVFLTNIKYFILGLFSFVTYRTFSRSIEIIFAFYLDIIDKKKKNIYLNSNKRIVLATKSYFEIIFNFATLNVLSFFIYQKFNFKYHSLFFSVPPKEAYCELLVDFSTSSISHTNTPNFNIDIFKIFAKSFGTTTFTDATVDSIFGMLQVMTTLVLVLFALAGYLNNKGDNN